MTAQPLFTPRWDPSRATEMALLLRDAHAAMAETAEAGPAPDGGAMFSEPVHVILADTLAFVMRVEPDDGPEAVALLRALDAYLAVMR